MLTLAWLKLQYSVRQRSLLPLISSGSRKLRSMAGTCELHLQRCELSFRVRLMLVKVPLVCEPCFSRRWLQRQRLTVVLASLRYNEGWRL
jgi:hypothetical protein